MRTDGHLPLDGADWKDGPSRIATKEEMRAWCDRAITTTRTTLGWQPKKESDDE